MSISLSPDATWLQPSFDFPDADVGTGPVLAPATAPLAASDGGTACERALMKLFGWKVGAKLKGSEIVEGLLADGHAKTTIGRALKRLSEFGTVRKIDQYRYVLAKLAIPKIAKNSSRPGAAANRFGHTNNEVTAGYIREFLMDRLDKVIENPNAFLVKVLHSIAWSERVMVAVFAQDADGIKSASAEYRKMCGKRPFKFEDLMEALQVGLFPEQFLDDEAVEREIEEHIEKVKAARFAEIADAVVENERIAAENENRVKAGQEPLPLVDCSNEDHLSAKEFRNGLIPVNGGERNGEQRLKSFLMVVNGELPAGL